MNGKISNISIIFTLLLVITSSYFFRFCTIHSFDERYIELFEACEKGDIFKVQELINKGYNINYERYISSGGKGIYYTTPLSVSTDYGNFDTCKLLIDNGAKPYLAAKILINRINNLKITIKTIQSKPVIKPLNTNPTEYEMKVFDRFKNNELSGIYIENINPNIFDKDGKYLLHYAIINRYYINMASLFAMGADPNYLYNNNQTFGDYFIENLKIHEELLSLYKNNMDKDTILKLRL